MRDNSTSNMPNNMGRLRMDSRLRDGEQKDDNAVIMYNSSINIINGILSERKEIYNTILETIKSTFKEMISGKMAFWYLADIGFFAYMLKFCQINYLQSFSFNNTIDMLIHSCVFVYFIIRLRTAWVVFQQKNIDKKERELIYRQKEIDFKKQNNIK